MSAPINAPETRTSIILTLSYKQKQKLEKAAAIRDITLDEYLLQVALDAAIEEIPESETIILSDRDWDIFTSAINNPPLPNEALKAAIKKHQEEYEQWK